MSWTERIETSLKITTGDGKVYFPLWRNAGKKISYNVTEFEFVEIEGALVSRKKPKARTFDFQLYFQGDNNIEQFEAFELSAKDTRPWTISHPFYNELLIQPTSITVSDVSLNCTDFVVSAIETITEEFPIIDIDPKEEITRQFDETNLLIAEDFANDTNIESSDISTFQDNNIELEKKGKRFAPVENSEAYFNAFNLANNALFIAIDNPLQAIIDTQQFIIAPVNFASSVSVRVGLLQSQFNELLRLLPSAPSKNDKNIFEAYGSTLITGIAKSTSEPLEDDFNTSNEVIEITKIINDVFTDFITKIDEFQSLNNVTTDSYAPKFESISSLFTIVNFTISNLLNIALESKKERSIITENDTNLIELTHRLYGLDEEDLNIQSLINQNNLGIIDYLQIKKGRVIKYFV